MYQPLCVAEHCGTPNQHGGDCPGDGCRGCLPRQAADGLRLCVVDTRRMVEDARTAAVLHEDLALVLIRRGRGGEKVRTSSSGAPSPKDEVMEARDAIYSTLTSLVRLISEERGITIPWEWRTEELPRGFIGPPRRIRVGIGYPTALAEYIAKNAVWLAAHPAAAEHAKDLRDVAGDRRSWGLAYPATANKRYAGRCTYIDEKSGAACGTDLYAGENEAVARCEICGEEYGVDAQQDQMREALMDSLARPIEIAGITLRLGTPVAYSTIAAYAQQGRVAVRDHDEQGRALYRVGDVIDTRMEAKGPRRVREHPRGAVNL